jgi:hypothetical protein
MTIRYWLKLFLQAAILTVALLAPTYMAAFFFNSWSSRPNVSGPAEAGR